MEEQLKEIEGLLETTARPDDEDDPSTINNIKKYLKLAFPHVALVAVVCLYATIGAYIFYRLESPNEDRLKAIGKKSIADMRTNLITQINTHEGDNWKRQVEQELMVYSDKLYKAFKEQYVRYSDVKHIGYDYRSSSEEIENDDQLDSERKRRHRHGKNRSDKSGEKMWTASSALFFAATTMATIGYGNIVPATSSGRIACVIFALFGAPLAIITIGDLGKFLSECTIWLYKHMRKTGLQFQIFVRRMRGEEISIESELENGNDRRKSSQQDGEESSELDWEDLVIDKTEVPVLMVFTILLLYIAFGGILFSILEDWSYMDAFYYSFISLTTIGFGDIVPENHDYIIIMLIYLGVGLSVTTMCIDLVGIQYIQKIHYFGRKFRGTDLLHLLKRKRMIERRLAMGQGEEILRMYVQHIEKEVEQMQKAEEELPPPPLIIKEINNSMMRIDDSLSQFNLRFYDTYDEEDILPPQCHSIRSFQPSIWSQSSARSYIYSQFQRQRGASWDESGPSLSEHCSLSTEPSVHIRQAFWDNYTSPTPSVTSFLHRHLYSPSVASTVSIDYENIAKASKQSTRSTSCPPIDVPSPHSRNSVSHQHHPNTKTTSSPPRRRPYSARTGLSHPEHAYSPEPLLYSAPLSFRLPEPFMLSNLAAICDAFEVDEEYYNNNHNHNHNNSIMTNMNNACINLASKNYHSSNLASNQHPDQEDDEKYETEEHPRPFVPKLVLSRSPIPPKRLSVIDENKSATSISPEPLLKRKHKERLARQQHPLHSFDWLNVSPRQFKPELLIRDDIPKLFKFVRNHHNSSNLDEKESISCETTSQESIVLISPRSPIGLACMQDWDSYIQMLEDAAAEFQYPSEIIDEEEYDEEDEVEAEDPIESSSMSPTLHTFISDYIPPEIFTSSSSSVLPTPNPRHRQLHFAPFIFYQPPPSTSEQYSMMSNNNSNQEENQDVLYEDEMEIEMPSPIPLEPQSSESEEEPVPIVVEEMKLKPQNDIDLGAFELVDSGLTPEALLSKDEPVIFHQSMPVHSVHHDTVQTEAALANLMAAPSSMLTNAIPPIMVEDNYCFVVDGERVRMGDILGDDQWWRHTSRPTKYFYSDDLKQFHRVNCITAKGKVITAKLATQLSHQPSTSSSLSASTSQHQHMSSSHHAQVHPQHQSMTNTPRSSISGGTFQTTHTTPSRGGGSNHHDANKVPLNNVYKVIRFYSFWKTCTSFHRIVTMIDKVVDEPSTTVADGNTFKKRLFVQYLWRNAKAVEKARVQKEFDPRRQRLLRFVTDPAARKRFQKM